MTPRLHELAAKYGVETHDKRLRSVEASHYEPYLVPRPDVVIAMELLAKLPNGLWTINHLGGHQWGWFAGLGNEGTGTFLDAVIALAERQEGI